MDYSLGLDLGTSSVKALLLGSDGAVVGVASENYAISVPHLGWAEQDPDDWWRASCTAIARVMHEAHAAPSEIVIAGLSGQMHGTVLLGADGRVLRPAIIWPDQRASLEADDANSLLQEHGLVERLGGGIASGFMVASLLWIQANEPDIWSLIQTILLPKDYVRYLLTGEFASEASDGSGAPLVDLETGEWSLETATLLGIPGHIFPPMAHSDDVAGLVTSTAATTTGLAVGTPILMGGSDQAMGAIGAGLLEPGDLMISLSTGGQIVAPVAAPLSTVSHGIRTLFHAVPGMYLALAATLGAGLSMQWLRKAVLEQRTSDADEVLMQRAATVAPGSDGLLFLPYIAGERSPVMDAKASGAFVGLRLDHGQAHLARAVLEGLAFSLKDALGPLKAAGVAPRRMVLAGGLAHNRDVQQIMADVLAADMTVLQTSEQSALGAALCGAVSAGFYGSLADACEQVVTYAQTVRAIDQNMVLYDARFKLYQKLYPSLKTLSHQLRQDGSDHSLSN